MTVHRSTCQPGVPFATVQAIRSAGWFIRPATDGYWHVQSDRSLPIARLRSDRVVQLARLAGLA